MDVVTSPLEKICGTVSLNRPMTTDDQGAILKTATRLVGIGVLLILGACAGQILKIDKSDEILRHEAYEQKVVIKELPVAPPETPSVASPGAAQPGDAGSKTAPKKALEKPPKPVKKPKLGLESEGAALKAGKGPVVHEPSIENPDGFIGRRPIKDPFRVGEKVTLSMSYFAFNAGTMEVEVLPFVEVNGRKAYRFRVHVKSNSFFSSIYAVDDAAVTYLDYDELVPLSLSITLKESKQLAETRTFFDWKNKKANYWQKKVTEKGESSKELSWDIPSFSQNVVSAAFYLRTFSWADGKSYALRVSDEGKNTVYRGEVVRREKLSTEIGTLNTVVIKPQVQVEGVFQPVGDILIWLTDDDRKFIVRIESKIKIGTVVAKLKSIDKGLDQ